MKAQILQTLYKLAPFPLEGDLILTPTDGTDVNISCLAICDGTRLEDLHTLLNCLSRQSLDKKTFEIILLNNGGGEQVNEVAQQYNQDLTIHVITNSSQNAYIGKNRNATLSKARGQYILFLDDDTRILQKDFLEKALMIFQSDNPDMIMPAGYPTYGIVQKRIAFLDKFSFATRCALFKRRVIDEIHGFKNNMTAFEDHEMGIRLLIKGVKIHQTEHLTYYHPPLYIQSMAKAYSFGQSLLRLRRHYSFLLWFVVYCNALRYLFYICVPTRINRQWFKLSLGVLLSPFKKHFYEYR